MHGSAPPEKCRDRGTFDPQIKEFLRRGTDTGKKSAVTATARVMRRRVVAGTARKPEIRPVFAYLEGERRCGPPGMTGSGIAQSANQATGNAIIACCHNVGELRSPSQATRDTEAEGCASAL